MKDRVKRTILNHDLIKAGDRILVALSGGPDSVALCHLLLSLREDLGFHLACAHLNHSLRPSADEEAAFVEKLCREAGLTCYIRKLPIAELAQEAKESMELTARRYRYDFFWEIMDSEGYDKTALGHHSLDQVETILMNLLRGSGLKGLGGIRVKRGRYIRPLLEVSRADIESFLEKAGLAFCSDETNQEDITLRNHLRLKVIPGLMARQPQLTETMSRQALVVQGEEDYLEAVTEDLFSRLSAWQKDDLILQKTAFHEPPALRRRLIRRAAREVLGDLKDFGFLQVEELLDLQAGNTGKVWFRGGLQVEQVYGDLHFSAGSLADEKALEPLPVDLRDLPKSLIFSDYLCRFSLEPMAGASRLDLASLGEEVILRTRQPGDRIQPLGMTGHKRVASLLIDGKVPRSLRDRLPVLVTKSGDIAYITPKIIGNSFRIKEKTDRILYITITERDYDKNE